MNRPSRDQSVACAWPPKPASGRAGARPSSAATAGVGAGPSPSENCVNTMREPSADQTGDAAFANKPVTAPVPRSIRFTVPLGVNCASRSGAGCRYAITPPDAASNAGGTRRSPPHVLSHANRIADRCHACCIESLRHQRRLVEKEDHVVRDDCLRWRCRGSAHDHRMRVRRSKSPEVHPLFASSGPQVNETLTVTEKPWPAIATARFGWCDPSRRTTGSRHPPQTGGVSHCRRKDDHVVCVPRSTATRAGNVADDVNVPGRQLDLLQLSICKKADRPAVRRPEWMRCSSRSHDSLVRACRRADVGGDIDAPDCGDRHRRGERARRQCPRHLGASLQGPSRSRRR